MTYESFALTKNSSRPDILRAGFLFPLADPIPRCRLSHHNQGLAIPALNGQGTQAKMMIRAIR